MRTQPANRHIIVYVWAVILPIGLATGAASAQIEFDPPALYAVEIFPTSVIAAELNGDGHLDMAVTNSDSNTVSVLFNSGEGIFDGMITFPAGLGPFALAAGDFDGDGDNDLAVVNKDTNLRLNTSQRRRRHVYARCHTRRGGYTPIDRRRRPQS